MHPGIIIEKGVFEFEMSENKNPSKITCYTVATFTSLHFVSVLLELAVRVNNSR